MKKYLGICVICLILALMCGMTVSAYQTDETSEDASDEGNYVIFEKEYIDFFKAVTRLEIDTADTQPVYLDDKLVLLLPWNWIQFETDRADYGFVGEDRDGHRAYAGVIITPDSGYTMEKLDSWARDAYYASRFEHNGITFFTALQGKSIVTKYLSGDGTLYMIFAYPDEPEDMDSEKLIGDLFLILCRIRPYYEGEAEQAADLKALKEKDLTSEEPVVFENKEFERMVREAMWKDTDETVYPSELAAIRNIYIRTGRLSFSLDKLRAVKYEQPEVLSLADLRLFPNLRALEITDMECSDYETLRGLSNLRGLELIRTGVTDCGFLEGLPLEKLSLSGNELSDFKVISTLANLKELNLFNTGLDSLEILRNLELTDLAVGNNPISDLEPVADMKGLTFLGLQKTNIRSLEALRNLTDLETLYINGLQEEISLEPLYDLPKLKEIVVLETPVSDVDREKLGIVIR